MPSTTWFATSSQQKHVQMPTTLRELEQDRPTRIAALTYVHRHSLDREDFRQLASMLGLADLLVKEST